MKYYIFFFLAFSVLSAKAQQNIAEAREKGAGQSVAVSGIVTNGSELGNIRYIQDNTAGIAAYGSEVESIQRGDSVTISGELSSYNNLLEIQPVNSVTIHSSGNSLPEPEEITIDEIGESYEGQLVRINNVRIVNPTGTFQSQTNYVFTSGTKQAEMRVSSSTLENKPMPAGSFHLVGICSQFSYNPGDVTTGYQILPRDEEDIILTGAVKIESPLSVSGITKTSVILSWETDKQGQSGVRFGWSIQPENLNSIVTGTSQGQGNGFVNEATISGLEPASIIYAQGFTAIGADTSFTSVKAFATGSNSSGDIKIYFNTGVDHSVSTGQYAEVLEDAIDDTLIAYINRAEESIDMCIYNINNYEISNITGALNNAHNRGVAVRTLTCGTTAHYGLDNNGDDIPGFPVLIAPGDYGRNGIMHNKFLIFDAQSRDASKPLVWTGSTNFTKGQINTDANNVVIIQDQSLAAAYLVEFEEMWGASGTQPDESNAKFGEEKLNNTPHNFVIGGKEVECYFSPSDGTNQQIINALETAGHRIDIATMLMTRSDIADAIAGLKQSGVAVNIITDDESSNSSTVNSILSGALGDSFIFDDEAPGILHHKYAIVDHTNSESGPLVLTGSHNWSTSANETNDENTLIIHDATIANLYYQNFIYRFHESGGVINHLKLLLNNENRLKVYPNPAGPKVWIASEENIQRIDVYSITGNLVHTENRIDAREFLLETTKLQPGLYFIKTFNDENKVGISKFVKH